MNDLTPLLDTARGAVDQALTLLHGRTAATVTAKGDRDMVSDLDIEIERRTRSHLADATPAIGFHGEEEGHHGPASQFWVLDPIDGTANLLRGLPICGISLALIREDRPVIGIIALPLLGQMFWAAEHLGAWRDNQPITAAGTASLEEAIVAVGDYHCGPDAEAGNQMMHRVHHLLAPRAQRVRMLGSAAADLAWVAAGALDASLTFGNNLWDMAAGAAIARQAGARVLDLDGTEHHTGSTATIAAAPHLADRILELLHDAAAPKPGPITTERTPC